MDHFPQAYQTRRRVPPPKDQAGQLGPAIHARRGKEAVEDENGGREEIPELEVGEELEPGGRRAGEEGVVVGGDVELAEMPEGMQRAAFRFPEGLGVERNEVDDCEGGREGWLVVLRVEGDGGYL
jgi:hypothetical protein